MVTVSKMKPDILLGLPSRGGIGYDRAFSAIFDSNLTTIITGVILFVLGTGPIRGYAITLCAGIIVSMFTALVVTRLIFNATLDENRVKPYKRQVSLTIVAALLTIIGYSINDTIVIFDRIREDMRKDPKTDFKTL